MDLERFQRSLDERIFWWSGFGFFCRYTLQESWGFRGFQVVIFQVFEGGVDVGCLVCCGLLESDFTGDYALLLLLSSSNTPNTSQARPSSNPHLASQSFRAVPSKGPKKLMQAAIIVEPWQSWAAAKGDPWRCLEVAKKGDPTYLSCLENFQSSGEITSKMLVPGSLKPFQNKC